MLGMETRLTLLNEIKEQLGLIEGNLLVLTEGLEANEEIVALSDCREATQRIHRLLDALEQSTGDEITLEMCVHGVKVAREAQSLGTKHCGCCGTATFQKLCGICCCIQMWPAFICSSPPPVSVTSPVVLVTVIVLAVTVEMTFVVLFPPFVNPVVTIVIPGRKPSVRKP